MDCKQVTDLMVPYLDGEVSAAERSEIEAHLAGCERCRRERDSVRRTQRVLRASFSSKAGNAEPPARAWEDLQPGLDIYRPSFLFLFRKRRWRIAATVILVALTVAAVLWASGILTRQP